jgi:hypothetical protein
MKIFHGTRARFEMFDVSYKGTGEAGTTDACWFTDNFIGAMRHAVNYNRNAGSPLVYSCELSTDVLLADHSIPLRDQPVIEGLLNQHLPVAISTSLHQGRGWHSMMMPYYQKINGKTYYSGLKHIDDNAVIELYKSCGLQGVYDWEGEFTDSYLCGVTTIIFEFSGLTIKDVIEIK